MFTYSGVMFCCSHVSLIPLTHSCFILLIFFTCFLYISPCGISKIILNSEPSHCSKAYERTNDHRSLSFRLQSPLSVTCRSPSLSEMPLSSAFGRRPTSHRNVCTKVLLAEGKETPFTEHCRNYENTYRVREDRQHPQRIRSHTQT